MLLVCRSASCDTSLFEHCGCNFEGIKDSDLFMASILVEMPIAMLAAAFRNTAVNSCHTDFVHSSLGSSVELVD